jgi:hypothetical protein
MNKFILIPFIFFFILACSTSNWEKRPAPAYKPYATAQGVR